MARRAAALAALLAVAACLTAAAPALAAPAGADSVNAEFAGIAQHGRVLGDLNAPVTMSFFHELKCPFCRAFDQNMLPKVVQRYVRSGRIRIVAYPQVFPWEDGGADSRRAARFAVALAQQNVYWNFIGMFYANQGSEADAYATDPFLSDLAAAIPGANAQQALAARNTAAVRNVLRKSDRVRESLDILGVPTLIVLPTGSHLENQLIDHTSMKSIGAAVRNAEREVARRKAHKN